MVLLSNAIPKRVVKEIRMIECGEKIASAEKYAEKFSPDPTVDSVFIGGSLTAGLGSLTSDVDLFVLVEENASLRKTWQAIVENNRIDVEVYTIREFETALDDVLSVDFSREAISKVWALKSKMDLIARFERSVVVKRSKMLKEAEQRLAAEKDKFYALLTNYWSLVFEAVKEDFIGSVLAGDYQTAVYLGQNLLSVAGKSFVSAFGDSYFGEKWVYQQLKRSCLSRETFQKFFSLQMGEWNRDGRRGAVEVLYMAQNLILAAQTMNTCRGRWMFDPNAFFTSFERGDNCFYRNPLYGAFKVGEGVQVHWEMHKDVVLSSRLLCLMGIAHKRCVHDMYQLIRENDDLVKIFGEVDEDALEGMLGKLQAKGLVLAAPSDASTLIRL